MLAIAGLAGCTADMQRTVAEAGSTYLVCGSAVRLDISHDGRNAVLREGDGRQAILKRVPSELGTQYAGDGVSVLRSNDIFIYTDRDGHTLNCDILPR